MTRYLPFKKGVYEISPGLRNFGADLGGGEMDRRLFQIDVSAQAILENKRASRAEGIDKYYCRHEFPRELQSALSLLIQSRLLSEYPKFFRKQDGVVSCALTEDQLRFDEQGHLLPGSLYLDSFDALAMQVPEDMALWRVDFDAKKEWLDAIHLCAPNHWAPSEKIGRSFAAVHTPVAGIGKINQHAWGLLESVIKGGPFVRFAWGIGSDKRLNHHPDAPVGRVFDPARPELYARVERQVLWPLPGQSAFLFTIRTYFLDAHEIKHVPEDRDALIAALQSMSPESLKYKGLEQTREPIVQWLRQKD